MGQDQTAQPSMYCRKCGYQLAGLSENRCPECGWAFDPADKRTYRGRPMRWYHGRIPWRLLVLVMTLLSVALAHLGWVYWDWHTQMAATAAIQRYGPVSITMYQPDPPWLVRQLGRRFTYLLDRPQTVYLGGMAGSRMTDGGMHFVGQMKSLQTLVLYDVPIGDEGLRSIQRLTELRQLTLYHTKVTDASLVHLRNLVSLEQLDLNGAGITDAGLAYLAKLTSLHSLGLGETGISDGGLKHLVGLPNLSTLNLNATHVTDAGLETLKQMRSSVTLYLYDTEVTPEGIQQLRHGRPDMAVENLARAADASGRDATGRLVRHGPT